MINGVPQKFGQEYKATNTVCNEKKRDVLYGYSYCLIRQKRKVEKAGFALMLLNDKKLIIGDIYTLDEAIVPNQMNF